MDEQEFYDSVQQHATIESREFAERLTVAVLQTLGERLSGGEAADLGATLPGGFEAALRREGDEDPTAFGPEEFRKRVVQRADALERDVEAGIRGVMAALADHGSRNELRAALEQLPQEYQTLFELPEQAG
jgi:uncharacterized protein (DUF2267 family)